MKQVNIFTNCVCVFSDQGQFYALSVVGCVKFFFFFFLVNLNFLNVESMAQED